METIMEKEACERDLSLVLEIRWSSGGLPVPKGMFLIASKKVLLTTLPWRLCALARKL